MDSLDKRMGENGILVTCERLAFAKTSHMKLMDLLREEGSLVKCTNTSVTTKGNKMVLFVPNLPQYVRGRRGWTIMDITTFEDILEKILTEKAKSKGTADGTNG